MKWNMPHRKDARRERAIEVNAERAKRTPQEQLAKLDAGGYAAKRERVRLERQISV